MFQGAVSKNWHSAVSVFDVGTCLWHVVVDVQILTPYMPKIFRVLYTAIYRLVTIIYSPAAPAPT